MSHEMSVWNKAHPDDPTYWTDSMFGGMPTTAISTQNGGDYTQGIYKKSSLSIYIWYLPGSNESSIFLLMQKP